MGARRRGMVYTHKSCESAHLPKIDPWITQRTLTGRVAVVVMEVLGCQPEVDVEGLLHESIKLTRLARRRRDMPHTHRSGDMPHTHRSCDSVHLQKNGPWFTHRHTHTSQSALWHAKRRYCGVGCNMIPA